MPSDFDIAAAKYRIVCDKCGGIKMREYPLTYINAKVHHLTAYLPNRCECGRSTLGGMLQTPEKADKSENPPREKNILSRAQMILSRGGMILPRCKMIISRGGMIISRGGMFFSRGGMILPRCKMIFARGGMFFARDKMIFSPQFIHH